MQTIRWGILGLGGIANAFAEGLKAIDDAELVACAARSQEKAEAFGEKWDVQRRYGSYEELAEDDGVDAVYVATAHPFHKACAILCLEHGKAVLCEKPFTVNARDAEEVVRVARENKVLLVEAIWSRFLPHLKAAREAVDAGKIGEVRMLKADFGFRCGWNPESRLLDPALAGGALLDVGVYTVSLSSMFMGTPTEIKAMAHLGETGVDEQTAVILNHDGGRLSLLSSAVRTNITQEAFIIGTEGSIKLENPWWRPCKFQLSSGETNETIEPPHVGNGYNYEAVELGRCLREGLTESPVIPLDETLSIMKTLDAVRDQLGLKYPME